MLLFSRHMSIESTVYVHTLIMLFHHRVITSSSPSAKVSSFTMPTVRWVSRQVLHCVHLAFAWPMSPQHPFNGPHWSSPTVHRVYLCLSTNLFIYFWRRLQRNVRYVYNGLHNLAVWVRCIWHARRQAHGGEIRGVLFWYLPGVFRLAAARSRYHPPR